jgi:hypothetical protein
MIRQLAYPMDFVVFLVAIYLVMRQTEPPITIWGFDSFWLPRFAIRWSLVSVIIGNWIACLVQRIKDTRRV